MAEQNTDSPSNPKQYRDRLTANELALAALGIESYMLCWAPMTKPDPLYLKLRAIAEKLHAEAYTRHQEETANAV